MSENAPRRPDDPVLAVVAPPRAARLLELAGLAPDATLSADFSGWSKLALLAEDRVLLVPRDHHQVEALRREERALRSLAEADLGLVPRVLAWHEDHDATPLPLLVVSRLPGVSLEPLEPTISTHELAAVLAQVGRAAARWHSLDPSLAPSREPRRTEHRNEVGALLGRTGTPEQTAARVGEALGLAPSHIARVGAAVERIGAIPDVFVHSDLHAGQVLIDPTTHELAGILDWQGARRDHPFVDVDLGEWSTAMWTRHRHEFPVLRAAFWAGHREVSRVDEDHALLCEWVWSVAHALSFEHLRVGGTGREHVVGTRHDAIQAARRATANLPT